MGVGFPQLLRLQRDRQVPRLPRRQVWALSTRSRPPLRLGFSLHRAQIRAGSGPLSARDLPGPPLPSRGARLPQQPPLPRGFADPVPHHSQLDRSQRVSHPALRCGDWAAVARQSLALGTAHRRPWPWRPRDWLRTPPVTDRGAPPHGAGPRPAPPRPQPGPASLWSRVSSAGRSASFAEQVLELSERSGRLLSPGDCPACVPSEVPA